MRVPLQTSSLIKDELLHGKLDMHGSTVLHHPGCNATGNAQPCIQQTKRCRRRLRTRVATVAILAQGTPRALRLRRPGLFALRFQAFALPPPATRPERLRKQRVEWDSFFIVEVSAYHSAQVSDHCCWNPVLSALLPA